MNIFFLKFRSNLENLKIAEILWNTFLDYQKLSEERKYWLNLSMHEIALNAIIHGNKRKINKWVSISIKKIKNSLKIEITDEGFCKNLPRIEDPGIKKNIFKNHGRGLFIAEKGVDELKFKILKKKNLKVILKIKE